MWPWYDRREERSVNNVLKKCGTYIKQLSFPGRPDCMSQSAAVEMLQHCCNVTKISLGTCLSGDDVEPMEPFGKNDTQFLKISLEVCALGEFSSKSL